MYQEWLVVDSSLSPLPQDHWTVALPTPISTPNVTLQVSSLGEKTCYLWTGYTRQIREHSEYFTKYKWNKMNTCKLNDEIPLSPSLCLFTLQARDQCHWRIYQPKSKDLRTLTFPRPVVIGGKPQGGRKNPKQQKRNLEGDMQE